MDIIGSFLERLTEPQGEQQGGIEYAFQGLLHQSDKPIISEFEQELIYGIKVTAMDKNGRRHWMVCYLNEDSPSLLCFIQNGTQEVVVLDVKNMDLEDDSQILQEKIPALALLPYLHLKEKLESVLLIFTDIKNRDAMLSNFRMMRLKLNFYDPYDEQFATAKKEFVMLSDHNNTIDHSELRRLAHRIGYCNSKFNDAAIQMVRRNSANKSTRITYTEFMEFLRLSYCTPMICDIFNRCVEDKLEWYSDKPNPMCVIPIMGKQDFSKFLIEHQKEAVEKIDQFIRSYCLFHTSSEETTHQNSTTISMYTFGRFLFSNENNILNPDRQQIYQDLTHPLNHYYCYSSHNTYLTGNQLTSKSKVKRYVEDLERGLKCVEIDVHESFGEIIVKHGFTPTSSILFEDVIKAIRHFSDQHSGHLPIIISLEVHLEPKQREKMAEILLNHLGRKIMLIEKGFKCFPSPLQLKDKIVIKTDCRMDPNLTMQQIEEQQEDLPNIPLTIERFVAQPRNKDQRDKDKQLQEHRHKWVTKDSTTMLTKMTGLYKGQFHQESTYCENVSMDWQKLMLRIKKDATSVVRYTSRSWLRVYPHGTQVLSSNYNPIPMMEIGAQIIALNTQVRDVYYYLLHAHFRENCCGYLLKPEELRSGHGLVREQSVKLQLQVVGSMNIRNLESYESFRYHVKLGFFGSQLDDTPANDMRNIKQVTEDVTEEDAVFESSQPLYYIFNQVYYAFIYFEIKDFGKVAVPVRMMREGYRALPLLNRNFEPIGASYLLIRVAFNNC